MKKKYKNLGKAFAKFNELPPPVHIVESHGLYYVESGDDMKMARSFETVIAYKGQELVDAMEGRSR